MDNLKIDATAVQAHPVFEKAPASPPKQPNFDGELEKVSMNGGELIDLLSTNEKFGDCWRSGSKIEELKINRIGEGKGFLSEIHKINVKFSNNRQFEFIMKIPKPFAFQEFIGKWQKGANNDHVAVDQCVVDGHNSECGFYNQIKHVEGCPLPKVYVAKNFESKTRPGLLLMENLAAKAETLGFHQWASVEQSFSIARCIAALQYGTSKGQLKEWSKKQMTSYFDDFYSGHLPDSMAAIKTLPGIAPLMSKLEPILSRKFGFHSIFEKPKECGALSLVHGDLQPNNLMFQKQKDGRPGDKLEALIDWQILFYGSASFDLARYMVMCPGVENRKKVELSAYAVYYSELQRLHEQDGQKPPFTYEQGLDLYELALCQQVGFSVMFLGMYHAMNPKHDGPLAGCFDQLLENAVYAAERAIEIYEKKGLVGKF